MQFSWSVLTPRNPAYRAEFRHQRFVIATSRSGWLWILLAAAMVIPALIGSVVYTLMVFMMPFASWVNDLSYVVEDVFFLPILVMSFAMYVVVTMITLGLSANSIQREKRNKTWDNLRLTNLDDNYIIWGKWGASLQALWGDHLMVAIIRIGLCAMFITAYSPNFGRIFGLHGEVFWMSFIVVVTLIYSFLDAGLTAALGIIASVAEAGAQAVMTLAFVVRAFVALAALVWFILTLTAIFGGNWGVASLATVVGWCVYSVLVYITLKMAQRLMRWGF